MLRKILSAILAFSLIAVLSPAAASARGGFGGRGLHGGGGFHGGFGGGGFRGRGVVGGSGWRGAGWRGDDLGWRGATYGALGVGLGLGLAGVSYGSPYGDEDDYPYGYGEYAVYGPWVYRTNYGSGCYLARSRVWTPYGWRLRTVQVCN